MSDIVLVRERLDRLRIRHAGLLDTKNTLNDELDRLNDAERSIRTALSEFGALLWEVPRSLSSIDRSRFRGDNRNRKSDHLDVMLERLESLRERHEDNLDLVRAQIRSHEDELSTVRSRLNTVNIQITNLEQEMRNMMT